MASSRYFLFDHNPNLFCDIFGNGMDTKNSAYGQQLTFLGKNFAIWAGDLGVIGIWSVYGIIPVIVIYILSIKILIHKYMPLFVKFMASASFLMPGLMSLHRVHSILWWVFMLYFYAYFDSCYKRGLRLDCKYNIVL
jgi:hypothetical protein